MSIDGFAILLASVVLITGAGMVVTSLVAERRREPAEMVLERAKNLLAMLRRIDEYDALGSFERDERQRDILLHAKVVFAGVLARDLRRDARLATLHRDTSRAIVRLRAARSDDRSG